MISTLTKRTIVSMIATYGTMVFLGFITLFFYFIGLSLEQLFIAQNPNTAPFSPITYFWASINPGVLIVTLLSPDIKSALTESVGISFPNWIIYLIFYVLITALSLTIAIRKLRANMKTNR